MLVTLQRIKENRLSTVGTITGGFFSLEDGFRDPKVHGETRIPASTYRLKLRTAGGLHAKYLSRFGSDFHHGMLWLQDVPDFEFVYIHIGNDVEDTDGCILIGSHIASSKDSEAPFRLSESEAAYRKFYPPLAAAIIRGDDCLIDIRDRSTPLVA